MTDVALAPVTHSLVTCPHCHLEVPAGQYCGNCGADLTRVGTRLRGTAYAAAPHEHVAHAALISTLFPHLPRRQAHLFREVFMGGVTVVLVLAAFRLLAPATLVAVLLLPVLYLLYLYESEVYEDEPLQVVALTFVVGGALGYLYVVIADHLSTSTLDGTEQGPLVAGVVLPLVLQAFMLVGPLLLLSRSRFDDVLDGLTFGAASALGLTLVATITASWHLLTGPLITGVATDDVLRIVRSGLVAAVVNAGTTGVTAAAIWLRVHRPARPGRRTQAWREVPAVVIGGFAAQVALGVSSYYVTSLLGLVVLWAVAAVALLIAVRVVLHLGLLEAAAEHVMGALAECPECHHDVPLMLFCSNCGASRLAGPKRRARTSTEATS